MLKFFRKIKQKSQPVFFKHLEFGRYDEEMDLNRVQARPSDYEKLVADTEFINALSFWRLLRSNSIPLR